MNAIKEEVCTYYEGNDILVDSFWEGHVLEATYYQIIQEETAIGWCGIHKQELMILFHIYKSYTYLAQRVFAEARRLESVFEVFVPTGDELLLGLALDNFSKLEKQAYFTRYQLTNLVKTRDVTLRLVEEEKDWEILDRYGKDFVERDFTGEIYIASIEEEVVGIGVGEKGQIRRDLVSIGMFVRPEYRRQGVGRSILIELKNVVERRGMSAISGCWYYNHNSLKTQLSLGNDCLSRLLRIKL